MTELTEANQSALLENGYTVITEAVSPELCARVVDLIWRHLQMDPNDSSTWYDAAAGIFELYHDQAMWDVRQYPPLHQKFADLLGTEKLWVSIDRVSMKPPLSAKHPEYQDPGFVHLDFDPRAGADNSLPWSVQGVVVLADTDADQGGFWCVPEIYRDMDNWARDQPEDMTKWSYTDFEPTPVPGRTGDIVIWSTRTPHGSGPNRSTVPRLAQYVTMFPARWEEEAERAAQVQAWQDRLVPDFGLQPFTRESEGPPAQLTALGRKLVGLDSW
jgi:hypothetical protein